MNKAEWTRELITRNCPNCESNDYVIISRTMKDGINLPTVICKKCSLVYTNPVPSEELYNRFYIEAYNDYYIHQEKFIPSLKGIPAYAEKIINIIHRYLSDTNSNILEVGTGNGSLLYYLVKSYPNAIGIEPGINSNWARTVYNLNIINDFFESHDFGDQKFEMILMVHVFEHFYNINRAVSKCRELLTENGYLFNEVPNILKPFKSPDHYFLRYVHPVNFSPQTIKSFLAKHAFLTLYEDSDGARGPNPKNIRVVARKTNDEAKISFQEDDDYKSVIRTLKFRRIKWYVWGWYYFEIIRLIRHIKSRLAASKAGIILKRILRRRIVI